MSLLQIVSADDKFHEECGLIGIWDHEEAANMAYLGLYAQQHRGQEGPLPGGRVDITVHRRRIPDWNRRHERDILLRVNKNTMHSRESIVYHNTGHHRTTSNLCATYTITCR